MSCAAAFLQATLERERARLEAAGRKVIFIIDQHFGQAITMNRAMGARPWLIRTQLQYAQAPLTDPQPEDRQRALSMLDDALASAQELGLKQLADGATKTLTSERQKAPVSVGAPMTLPTRTSKHSQG